MVSRAYLQEIGLLSLHPEGRPPVAAPRAPAAAAEPAPAADATASATGGKAAQSDKAAEDGKSRQGGKAGKCSKAATSAGAQSSSAVPVEAPPKELSPEELAKLPKEQRAAYYAARRAAQGTPAPKAKQMSKAERREMQEVQRKAKEDLKKTGMVDEEMLQELKLQGLTEEQAKEVMAELARTKEEQAEEEEEDEPEDFLSSVRKWMSEQDAKVPDDALHDFNMKVRFQGHVDTTPPDHISAILRVLAEEACKSCDFAAPKLQPAIVAKKVESCVTRWAPLLEPLYGKIDDPLVGADAVVGAVQEGVAAATAEAQVPEAGRACGVVGCLMALRDIDMIEDEDLLTGCKRCEPRSRIMDKFIEFLEEELEEEGEEDEEGEAEADD